MLDFDSIRKLSQPERFTPPSEPVVLLVDDTPENIMVMRLILEKDGYIVKEATSAEGMFDVLKTTLPDLILLDVMMPDTNGYETCSMLKKHEDFGSIPVIFITAKQSIENVVQGFDVGAVDYIVKPVNNQELLARVQTHIQLKRAQDEVKLYSQLLGRQKKLTSDLLSHLFPEALVEKIHFGEKIVPLNHESATIMCIDVVGFTKITEKRSCENVVNLLNILFDTFDSIVAQHGLIRIKTLGDNYIAVAGIPNFFEEHIESTIRCAKDILKATKEASLQFPEPVQLCISIATGPMSSGIVGSKTISFDVWGKTVNTAIHLEQHCEPGQIIVTDSVQEVAKHAYNFIKHEDIETLGKKVLTSYFVGDYIGNNTDNEF
jgi:DNA-binding response OmpR family regulator